MAGRQTREEGATPEEVASFRDHVISLFQYEPETGRFYRRKDGARLCQTPRRYGFLRINAKSYLAHRIAWLIVTGNWPAGDIDHADLDRSNNAFLNLRVATHSQNHSNSRPRRHSRLGVKDVSSAENGRFKAQITINGKNNFLGRFDTAEEAHAAYLAAAKKAFGEFARAA